MDRAQPFSGLPKCGARGKTCVHCGIHKRLHADLDQSHPFEPKPCARNANETGRCIIHGGASPRGVAHYNHQGKGTSVVLPTRMLQDYERARTNPDRLSLEDEIAELRAMKADCWRQLEQNAGMAVADVKAAVAALSKAYDQALVAQRSTNAEKFAEALGQMGDARDALKVAMGPVAAMEAAKAQVADLNIKVEKLLRAENNRNFDERGMISLETALADRHALVMMFLGAVMKHVGDGATQKAIRRTVGNEYARLTGRRNAASVDAAGGSGVLDAEHSPTTD